MHINSKPHNLYKSVTQSDCISKFVDSIQKNKTKFLIESADELTGPIFIEFTKKYLLSLGFATIPFEQNIEFYGQKKFEAVSSLLNQNPNIKEKEDEEQTESVALLLKNVIAFFLSKEFQSAARSKDKKAERWIELLKEIYSWVIELGKTHIDLILTRNISFFVKLTEEVLKNYKFFENMYFLDVFEKFVNDFLGNCLSSAENQPKLIALDWISESLEKYETLQETLVGETTLAANLFERLLWNFQKTSFEIKKKTAHLILQLLNNSHPTTIQVFFQIFLKYKDFFFRCFLKSNLKEIELSFDFLTQIQTDYKLLPEADLMKYFLFIFHDTKTISQIALHFYLKMSDFPHSILSERLDKNLFLNFLDSNIRLVECSQQISTSKDIRWFYEMIGNTSEVPNLDFGIFSLMLDDACNTHGSKLSPFTVKNLSWSLMGLLKSKSNANREQILTKMTQNLSFFKTNFEQKECVDVLIELLVSLSEDSRIAEIESLLHDLNDILKETQNEKVIATILLFFKEKKEQSKLITEFLNQHFEICQVNTKRLPVFGELERNVNTHILKVVLISKIFAGSLDIFMEFENIENIFKNCLNGNCPNANSQLIILLCDFKMTCLKSRLSNIVDQIDKDQIENELLERFIFDTIQDFEKVAEFADISKNSAHFDGNFLKQFVFEKLIEVYGLISTDAALQFSFLYHKPTDEQINKLADMLKSLFVSTDLGLEDDSDTFNSKYFSGKSLVKTQNQVKEQKIELLFDLLLSSQVSFGSTLSHVFVNKSVEITDSERIHQLIQQFLVKVLEKQSKNQEKFNFFKIMFLSLKTAKMEIGKKKNLCRLFCKALNQFSHMKIQNQTFQNELDSKFFQIVYNFIRTGISSPEESIQILETIPFLLTAKKLSERSAETAKNFVYRIFELKNSIDLTTLSEDLKAIIENIINVCAQYIGLRAVNKMQDSSVKFEKIDTENEKPNVLENEKKIDKTIEKDLKSTKKVNKMQKNRENARKMQKEVVSNLRIGKKKIKK